jgi:hypothetical protein
MIDHTLGMSEREIMEICICWSHRGVHLGAGENVVALILVYCEEGRSESRKASYLYSRVLSRRDSIAFPS